MKAMGTFRTRAGWLLLLAATFAVAAVTPASAAKWTAGSLTVPETSQSELLGVDCFSSSACTAVGKDGVSGGPGGAFGETWNGSSWTFASGITRNPSGDKNGVLRNVSCVSATTCVAVGSYGHSGVPTPWAQTRSESGWKLWTLPVGSQAELNDVSCVEPTKGSLWCMAVGYKVSGGDDKPFAMTFNGTTWSESSTVSKENATLKGVSCLSTSFCMAVGETTPSGNPGRLLDEIWEGKWTAGEPALLGSGNAPVLNGVDCLIEKEGGKWCMAVGTVQKSPGGWKAVAPTWHAVSGVYQWFSGSEPQPHTAAEEIKADGVSCLAVEECWTVGESLLGNPWADKWNNKGWEPAETVPFATGSSGDQLHDIACYAAFSCKAVGWSLFGSTPKALVDTATP